jgi:hypothetical protein
MANRFRIAAALSIHSGGHESLERVQVRWKRAGLVPLIVINVSRDIASKPGAVEMRNDVTQLAAQVLLGVLRVFGHFLQQGVARQSPKQRAGFRRPFISCCKKLVAGAGFEPATFGL